MENAKKLNSIKRNVKKVLALVLAFACAFTMFAGAAFTDTADISQTEAVDMLTALGVIDGYDDGSFRPEATVTRAEMAKMIYTIRTGSSDASAYNNDATTFTDINGHWARGYIKYCQSLGIIAGKSTTSFDPDATVTTQEAAKMLLVTLGYNAEKAGLEGSNWGAKTTALADENGLLKDVNNGTTQGLPRQYAAQLMYNAIFANTVTLRDGEYTKYGYDNSLNPTIGEKYMDLYKTEAGVLYSCTKVDGKDYYTIKTSGTLNDKGATVNNSFNKVPTDVSSMIGQEIIVLRKVNASDETVYGVYTDDDSKVVATGYVGQMESVTGSADKIKLAGTEYKLDGTYNSTAMVYTLNRDVVAVAKTTLNAKLINDSSDERTRNNAAAEIKLIDNDGNGKVDTAVYTPVQIGKVSAVTKTSITVGSAGTFKFADDTIYDGVAKNDYVRIIDEDNVSSGGNHIEKLDVVNAKVEGERASSNEIKVNGTWYKLAYDGTNYVSATNGTTYDMVIVGNTVLYADETEGSVANVAYISAVDLDNGSPILGTSNFTQEVRMYFTDGTDATVKVSKIDGDKLIAKNAMDSYANLMVTYTKLSDGTYDVKKLAEKSDPDKNLAGCDEFVGTAAKTGNSGNSAYHDSKIGGVSIADNAVIFVETEKETKVLTGAQVKSWAEDIAAINFAGAYLYKTTNGIDYIQVASLNADTTDEPVPGAKDTSYAYAVTDEYTTTFEGETKAAVDAWDGSNVVTLYVDGGSMGGINAGDLFSYRVNGKFIDNISKASHCGAILGFDGKAEGEIKILYATSPSTSNSFTYTLDEDCVVLTVNDAANEGVAGATIDSLVEAGTDPDDSSKRLANVRYFIGTGSDSNKIVAIMIDSEDNMLDANIKIVE